MGDIAYKKTGYTSKETHPRKGQTFNLADKTTGNQLPGTILPPSNTTRGWRQREWRVAPQSLANAQTTDLVLTIQGSALWIKGASTDLIFVAFDNAPDYLPMYTGDFIVGFPFQQLRIQFAAQGTDMIYICTTQVYPDEDTFKVGQY